MTAGFLNHQQYIPRSGLVSGISLCSPGLFRSGGNGGKVVPVLVGLVVLGHFFKRYQKVQQHENSFFKRYWRSLWIYEVPSVGWRECHLRHSSHGNFSYIQFWNFASRYCWWFRNPTSQLPVIFYQVFSKHMLWVVVFTGFLNHQPIKQCSNKLKFTWVFPKIVVPPNHPF